MSCVNGVTDLSTVTTALTGDVWLLIKMSALMVHLAVW